MSAATFISRILGYVKDMILARYFGATGLSDTFFVAFRIPNLLRELFAEGSISSAFIPVLTEYQTKHGPLEAKRLVNITLTFILIFVGSFCVLGIFFAPQIVSVIAPGFLKDPGKFSQTVLLTRLMFPFLLFISLAALTMGALNVRRVFFVPALAPAMLNVTIIVFVLALVPVLEQPITAVALGVTFGGLAQLAFQLPSFLRRDYDPGLAWELNHPGLRKMALLIMPATMGMAVAQVNIFVSTILASFLPQGSITYLYYSMRLIQFPVGIFGVAMGMAVLPALSEHAVRGEIDRLRDDFSFALRLLFFITVPAMMGLIALRGPIVNLLFQRGIFDHAATAGTADALLFYSMGIWAIVGVRVVTATFYSLNDTKTPVKIAVAAMIINVALSAALMGPLKHSGLAFANAIASSVNFILLFFFLRSKLGRVDGKRIMGSFARIAVASMVMALAGRFMLHGGMWTLSGKTLEKTIYLSGTIVVCLCIYLFISFVMKGDEMNYLCEKMKSRLHRSGS